MFHIKQDKRSQNSARLITEGVLECMKEKAFIDITISDIQRKSGVGRATFYRLFDTTIDVMAYECDNVFAQLMKEGEKNRDINNEEALLLFYHTWTAHSRLLEILVETEHVDILYNTCRKYADTIHSILIPSVSLCEEEIDYFVSITIYAMLGSLVTWIKHGKKESAESLSEIYMTTINALSASC